MRWLIHYAIIIAIQYYAIRDEGELATYHTLLRCAILRGALRTYYDNITLMALVEKKKKHIATLARSAILLATEFTHCWRQRQLAGYAIGLRRLIH